MQWAVVIYCVVPLYTITVGKRGVHSWVSLSDIKDCVQQIERVTSGVMHHFRRIGGNLGHTP